MKRIVFYSWQSDLPNATNRGFIEAALSSAAKEIAADKSIEIEPVIDRDTLGASGSPDISATIFAKIAIADVFVADVSIIAKPRKGRPTPNPNVLIELGYALRAHGPDKILMLFNEAFGKISDLPFDLKMRRIIPYNEAKTNTDRAAERNRLSAILQAALRTALTTAVKLSEPSTFTPAVTSVENGEPKRIPLIRRALAEALSKLDGARPKIPREGGEIDDLLQAVDASQEVVADVAKLSESVAVMSDESGALELGRWFGAILERYDLPKNFSGTFNRADFDYFKFVGYEMFTNLVAALLRDRRWSILQRLLREPIPVNYSRQNNGPDSLHWNRLSAHAPMLMGHGEAINRLSFVADLIEKRHTGGALAQIVAFREFIEADYLLYLRSYPAYATNAGKLWIPWTIPYLDYVPMFIREAQRTQVAKELAATATAKNIDDLRSTILNSAQIVPQMFPRGYVHFPIDQREARLIGSVE